MCFVELFTIFVIIYFIYARWMNYKNKLINIMKYNELRGIIFMMYIID